MDAVSTGQKLAKETKPSEKYFGFCGLTSSCQKVIFGHLNPLQRFPNHIAVTSVCPELDLRTQVALLLLTGGGVINRLLVPRLLQLVQF